MSKSAPHLHVLGVATGPDDRVAVLAAMNRAVRAGAQVTLLTADRAFAAGADRRIEIIDIGPTNRARVLDRAVALGPAQIGVGVVGLLLAVRGRRARTRLAGLAAVGAALVLPAPRSPWWDRWAGSQLASDTAAWQGWRATRSVLDRVDPADVDVLVHRSVDAWAIIWNLVRLNPAIEVRHSLDDDVLADFAALRREWLIEQPGGRRILRREQTLARLRTSKWGRRAAARLPAAARRRLGATA